MKANCETYLSFNNTGYITGVTSHVGRLKNDIVLPSSYLISLVGLIKKKKEN